MSSSSVPVDQVPEVAPRGSSRGKVRPREEKEKTPAWVRELFDALKLSEDEIKEGIWKNARSKTVSFNYGDESEAANKSKPRQISSRQYVLYCSRTNPIVAEYEKVIKDVPHEEIGFWKAHSWKGQVLVLVDNGKSEKEGKPEVSSFTIVALAKVSAPKPAVPEITVDKDVIYTEIKSFLNIVDNASDPPEIIYSDPRLRSEVDALYEKAKKAWELFFTKNVSVVTKEKFRVVTGLDVKLFDKLTRLQHVVEKEDWYKICMFLCSDPSQIEKSRAELKEAVKLVDEKVLHFSFMTMIDDYSITNSVTGIDIMPAFRLWRYSFYQLFIRTPENTFQRFFLCKHHQNDRCIFSYDPYRDRVTATEIKKKEDVEKDFFYIVAIDGGSSDKPSSKGEPCLTFNSLKELYEDLSSGTPSDRKAAASSRA